MNAPPRIAVVTQGLAVGGGGVSTIVRWLREELRALGYEVDVHDLANSRSDRDSRRIVRPGSWLRRSLAAKPDDHADLQHWGANLVEIEPMRYRPRAELTRALQGYDLIQVVSGGPAVANAVAHIGCPVVLQIATSVRWERQSRRASFAIGTRPWRDIMTAWTARVERQALRRADLVLVLNEDLLAFVNSAGQHKAIVAPPGVDTSRFTPAADGWNSDGYILSVCRLAEPRKGIDRVVHAYQELVRILPGAPPLVLAGRGHLPDPLWRLVVASGLERRVSVKTDVDPVTLAELYRGASVFVQASHEEGLGISVLEAMASGLPVVATSTSGTRETIVDGYNGWLVPQGDEDALIGQFASRVEQVFSQTGPAMAVAARERCVDMFSTKVALARYLQSYDRLLASAIPRGC